MKKIILILAVVMLGSSLCFAQKAPPAVRKTFKQVIEIKTFSGKIFSVTITTVKNLSMAEIGVVNEKKERHAFTIRPGTRILAKDGKEVSLKELRKDLWVTIGYTEFQKGVYKAKTVKLE